MKHNVVLTVASLLLLLFMTFHLTHDTIRLAEGAMTYPIPVVVLALWLYGTAHAFRPYGAQWSRVDSRWVGTGRRFSLATHLHSFSLTA